MANSADFRSLEKRFKALQSRLLPRKLNPTGTYTKATLDKATAFRLLMHAEIEHYFERRALWIATAAYDRWKSSFLPSAPLVCLVCNVVGEQKGFAKQKNLPRPTALTLAGKCYGQYKHSVESNNGIKTDNLMELLLPISVLESDFDPVWLATIDSFAMKRGESAHKSSVTYLIDPQTELNTLIFIVDGIRDLDLILNKIAKQVK